MIAAPKHQLWRLPACVLLAMLCALQLLCILRAPPAYAPAEIEVRLRAGEALTLGRRELAAPQADANHLALRRDAAGRWLVQNASADRQLLLQRGGDDQRTGAAILHAADRFQLGAAIFEVESAGDGVVAFTDGVHRWRYDGATLLRDGQVQPPCPDAHFGARAAALWNRWLPRLVRLPRPAILGGNLNCANRIGIAGVEAGGASLAGHAGAIELAAGRGPVLIGGEDLARREFPLSGVDAFVVGHTRLALALDGDTMRLRPVSHVALFASKQVQLPPGVGWSWRARDCWTVSHALASVVLLAAVAGVVAGLLTLLPARARPGRWGAVIRVAAAVLLVVAGGGVLVLQRAGSPVAIAFSLLLAWGALWYALLAPPRLELGLAAGVLLLAAGLLVQLELGLGGTDSSWPRHFQKSAALLAVGLPAICWTSRRSAARPLSQAGAERILLLLAAVALVALALQVALGSETGVFDLQPVEPAKLALAALTAHCIALGLDGGAQACGGLMRWLRLTTPALLFVLVLAVGLVQVDDYSPLILLLVWGWVMAFAWGLAARRIVPVAALAASGCAAVFAVALLHATGAAQVSQWSFYPERFLVWLDPSAHPHTGQQLLMGARAVAGGGWLGADGMAGLSSLGQDAGAALRIPAVQDDFAPSLFLNRHGLAAAIGLWLLQALFLVGLALSAAREWLAGLSARDFRSAWLARFRCFALCGGAGFVLGHFLLSWGTNLSIFPIMGQPMSFLSAGGSHLLFFICPLLVMSSASATSSEENNHAGVCAT